MAFSFLVFAGREALAKRGIRLRPLNRSLNVFSCFLGLGAFVALICRLLSTENWYESHTERGFYAFFIELLFFKSISQLWNYSEGCLRKIISIGYILLYTGLILLILQGAFGPSRTCNSERINIGYRGCNVSDFYLVCQDSFANSSVTDWFGVRVI
jgi:hypothetical protein